MSIPGPPQSEPPRCPGHTSQVSGRTAASRAATGRCRERLPPCPSPGPAARCRPRRACRLSGRPRARRRGRCRSGRRPCARAGGRGCGGPGCGRCPARAASRRRRARARIRARRAVDVDLRAGCCGQAAVSRDVVGMVVRLEHVLDVDAEVAGDPQVLLDVELRVDNGRDASVLVTDEIRRAAEVVVGDLAEDHQWPNLTSGRTRSRAFGSHHAQRPSRRSSTGTSRRRTRSGVQQVRDAEDHAHLLGRQRSREGEREKDRDHDARRLRRSRGPSGPGR